MKTITKGSTERTIKKISGRLEESWFYASFTLEIRAVL